ncbi:phosphotransferase family protein [Haladaptatus sp. NG-SE-30]
MSGDSSDERIGSSNDPLSVSEVRVAMGVVLPDARIVDVTPVEHGKNAVYSLTIERDGGEADHTTDPERVVLKVATATDENAFRVEPRLLELVASRTAIPVPRVLGSNIGGAGTGWSEAGDMLGPDAGNALGRPYFVMEAVEGRTLELRPDELPPDVLERACFEAGRNLGELHASFSFDGFGPVRPDDAGTLRVSSAFENWPTLFETAVKANADRLADTRFGDLVSSIRSHAETVARRLDDDFEPVLMHHDYRLANLVLDSDAVAGSWDGGTVTNAVLDWGEPATGHAEYELVQTEAVLTNRPELSEKRQETLRKRLYEGYDRTNSLTRDSGFWERHQLYRLATLVRMMKNFETILAKTDADADTRATEYRRLLEQWADSL